MILLGNSLSLDSLHDCKNDLLIMPIMQLYLKIFRWPQSLS